jgi:ubiquinone/menaquinone biosynthesis C-methylase UbiE
MSFTNPCSDTATFLTLTYAIIFSMNDQKQFWNNAFTAKKLFDHTTTQTDFAEEILQIMPAHANILNLGCGNGNDDALFAKAGHTIIATDFSEVAIKKNIKRFKNYPKLHFTLLDITETFPFNDNKFDIVYARLSLHYFADTTTRKIINEIARVLKPNGYLCFVCKSTNDKLYGKGTEIEKDMFEENGHVRHFFNKDYTKSLLKTKFKLDKMESGNKKLYTRDASFIKVIAQSLK